MKERRDIVRLEPELDLALGVRGVGRGVDEVVHPLADHLAFFIAQVDDHAQGPDRAGLVFARAMRIGGAHDLPDFRHGVRPLVDDGDDAAPLRGVRVMGQPHDVVDERRVKHLPAVFGVMFFGQDPIHLHDLHAGESQPGVEFGKLGEDVARQRVLESVWFY